MASSSTAFAGIAPQPSQPSSTLTRKAPYHVFINHRGCDVKHKLASTIYHTLDLLGISAFLDQEELELGDSITTELQEAIQGASLHIAIFSEKYAESPWCLAELCSMLKTGTPIIPVFYHVKPDDLRWVAQGKGIYANAFYQHQKKRRYSSKMLREWKTALQSVSYLSGYMVNNDNGDEGRLLKSIVNSVLKEVKTEPLEVAKHPVGMDEIVQDFESSILQCGDESEQHVQIVGIVGFGGAGKTTLAKELYNRKRSSINRSSFLFDVRDAATKNALLSKQKDLLEDLRVQSTSFHNTNEGKAILANRLRSVYESVLIVLDDVDHQDQLDTLLPPKDSLRPGSLIIVTTREGSILTMAGITSVYRMRPLHHSHAEKLFCWHAFLRPSPLEGFQDLVEKFLNVCDGLPLSLKVIGAQLYCRNSRDYWESQLAKIQRILPKDIKDKLKVSYDALDKEEQEIFLDVACFFIGEKKNLAIAVWDGSGWSGPCGWETLFNKCLVELDDKERIKMHDHLRDLGREIAMTHSPSRLFSTTQSIRIQGGMFIRGIMPTGGRGEYDNGFKYFKPPLKEYTEMMKNSSPTTGLQLLGVAENDFTEEFAEVSTDLVWLQWYYFQHRNLPSWLSLEKLRVLELYYPDQLRELWKDEANPPLQLRELVIECGWLSMFKGFPRSIGLLKHLKILKLDSTTVMRSLPEELCHLQSLQHLELKECTSLSSLPIRFGDLINLRHLNMSGCDQLRTLPVSFKQLTLLQYLNLVGCRELTMESESLDILENITRLQYLNFTWCRNIKDLPRHIGNGVSLKQLSIYGTRIRELPPNIGQLSKLEILRVGSPELECLPDSLGCLNNLEDLIIFESGVKTLPESFTQLINLQSLYIGNTPTSELSFGPGCKLKKLSLHSTKLSKISISADCCPCLTTLRLQHNDYLMEIETLPTAMETIKLVGCEMLKDIRSICGLVKLEMLSIRGCPELDGLPSFAELTSLKTFELKGCHKVEKIEGLEYLRSLENLTIRSCRELYGLPSFAELTSLKAFELRDCHKVEKIEGLEELRSLEEFEAYTCLKVPCIINLEQTRELREVVVVANEKSVVEHCIPAIHQKWPDIVIICTRAVCNVGSSPVNSLAFPNLSVLGSIANAKIGSERQALELWHERSSSSSSSIVNANAILICIIINVVSPVIHLVIRRGYYASDFQFEMDVGQGRWVWMGVFTQNSFSSYQEDGCIIFHCSYDDENNVVESAWLMEGEVESFRDLFHTFAG